VKYLILAVSTFLIFIFALVGVIFLVKLAASLVCTTGSTNIWCVDRTDGPFEMLSGGIGFWVALAAAAFHLRTGRFASALIQFKRVGILAMITFGTVVLRSIIATSTGSG
jgi:hypothetical protein